MVKAITILFVFQLLGETIIQVFALPIPGPVVGMALLFGVLLLRRSPSPELKTTAQGLVRHLSLLFIPAGTGIIAHAALLRDEGVALAVTLVVSTLVTMAVTAVTLRVLARSVGRKGA